MDELTLNEVVPNIPIHERIKVYIEENGIKQAWLAEKVLRSRGWLTQILNGTLPLSQEMLERIEFYLKTKF